MRRAPSPFAVLALAILGASPGMARGAGGDVIFTLSDPRGDDHGDGSLVYPRRDDLAPGDLDVVSFAARREADGTAFEVTFARRIQGTNRRTIDVGGGNLDEYARYGFYTFNVDVYIDTDGVSGSGNVQLLPGRGAEAEAKNAWEKVVCLTPRPSLARADLKRIFTSHFRKETRAEKGKVEPGEVKEAKRTIDGELDEQVFFPTRIRISGGTVSFFAPDSFLGGPARADWSYTVVVTGATVDKRVDLAAAVGIPKPDSDNLAVLPVGFGRPSDRFGTDREDPMQTPIVDLIVPPGRTQEEILKDSDPKQGRPVRLSGVVPAPAAK